MSAIDDPFKAIEQQFDNEPQNPGVKALIAGLQLISPVSTEAKIISAVKQFFSRDAVKERNEALFDTLKWYVEKHEKRIEEVEQTVTSPEYLETLMVAIDKTNETTNIRKIKRFAVILGYEAVNAGTPKNLEDASAFIRALNELGEEDVKVLGLLHLHQGRFFESDAYMSDSVIMSTMRELMTSVLQSFVSVDEYYSRCLRLSGYGLVLVMERRRDMISPGDYAFRLTSLGNHLAVILKSAGDNNVIAV